MLFRSREEGAGAPTDGELEEYCRGRLSGYKVPRLLVRVSHIRRSPSGKPDYPWAKELVTEAARHGG